MTPNPFLGVLLHSIGGLCAASFYVPYRRVKSWSWETYWLAGGVFAWIVAPWILAFVTCPNLLATLREAPPTSLWWAFFFGLMWGVGGLTFGLTMRYLGIALGMAIALGFCSLFGTLMPALFKGQLADILTSTPLQMILLGVLLCLAGIGISGLAGRSKERELSAEHKTDAVPEFNFPKGLVVAVFSGILSAAMAYGIAAGKPIADLAVNHGALPLWKTNAEYVVILAGGFLTNLVYCAFLHSRNHSGREYARTSTPLASNYLFCAIAGVAWYMQFMFYGMGTTKMGRYDFSSWSLHMSSIIIFSTLWGIALKEWRGSSSRTHALIAFGLAVLVASMMIVGYGNYLAAPPTH